MAVLLPSVFYAFSGVAQTSLSERLNYVLESQDMEMGLKLYQEITTAEITQLADSSLFNYHYLGAYINSELMSDNEKNYEKALSHFLEAKRLCETSIGVHSGDYMEIMRGLGDTYIELGQCEEAVNIYQEGIVKSMYMREAASHDFGNLIIGLQECYELLGWFDEVPSHLKDAWIFWKKDFEPFETNNYYPLWCLMQFYRRYGMNDKALAVCNRIIEFISEQVGTKHPEMAEALWWKGNILRDMDKYDDAVKIYYSGISILKENGLEKTESYIGIVGNLLIQIISIGQNNEFDKLLNEIKNYSDQSGDTHSYFASIYASAQKYYESGIYDKALSLNAQSFDLDISNRDRELVEDQRRNILYAQDIDEEFPSLLELYNTLPHDSREWFEIGIKLSDVFFIRKDGNSGRKVQSEMFDAINKYPEIGKDYLYSVLNSLYNINIENKDYNEALRYAYEIKDFVYNSPEASEYNYLCASNNLVVAKMKCGIIESIDEDLDKEEMYTRLIYGENSSDYAYYLHNRGRAYQLQDKLEVAKETLLKSITLQNKVKGKPLDQTFKYYMELEQQLGEL